MRSKRVDPAGLLITVGIHVVVVLALLAHHPTRQKLAQVAPFVVKLITPSTPQPAPPRPTLRTPPRFAAPTTPRPDLPPVVLAPAEPTRPAPPTPPVSAPAPASTVAAPTQTPSPSASELRTGAPAEITPPVFNADYLSNPAPEYPGSSRRLREEGRVILRVFVRRDGTAAQVQVRTSSGYARLDGAARDAVLRWKFIPAKRGAELLEEWVLIPLSFRLES